MESKRVLIYCRESRDENGQNYERIETQRDLLVKYCNNHGYTNIVKIIMDDDKSGTDFSRFEQVKKMVEKRQIDVIVFKNSARLGRNQKESISFVEYLEEQGIEIIFEDEQYNEEMFGLYAWFNERRARDDSKNIKRNLRHKMEEGQLLIRPIYGYEKKEKGWMINPETSKVVKEIFRRYSQGESCNQIAKYLNEKQIPTPSKMQKAVYTKKSDCWEYQHIYRILQDQRYLGDYVGGKTEKVSFKSKKIRNKKPENWVIIKSHHPPIITEKIWEEVQQRRKRESRQPYHKGKNNLYSGILHCGKCEKPMYKKTKKEGKDYYICQTYYKTGRKGECLSHYVKMEDMNNFIMQTLEEVWNSQSLLPIMKRKIENRKKEEKEIIQLEKQIQEKKQQYKQLYEDKLRGIIPLFIFQEKKVEIEKEIQEKSTQWEEEKKRNKTKMEIEKEIEKAKQKDFTREEIQRLVEKIIVFSPNEITKTQKDLYNINNLVYNKLREKRGDNFHSKRELSTRYHNQEDVILVPDPLTYI